MILSRKIKEIRSSTLRLTQSEFAKKLGFNRIATISDYEKGKRAPDITTLRKIADLGGVTIDWLTSGESTPYDKAPQIDTSSESLQDKNYISVDVYNSSIEDAHTSKPKSKPIEDLLIPKKYHQKNAITIRFDGESMAPTILNGATVGINKANKNLISGKLFALWIKHEGLTIRRVYVYPDKIELVSDNSSFPATTIKTTEIDERLIVGVVSWIFQSV